MAKKKRKPKIDRIRRADDNHAVVTVVGGGGSYCKVPCPQCPWRKDQVGTFPAEAFRLSANTAYDMNEHTFACHMAGSNNPATCAGFLLRGANHNMSVRLSIMSGKIDPDSISENGVELHENYRAMAVANGVSPDDPVLEECRD